MTTRIYVATSSREPDLTRARMVMGWIRELPGFEVAYDWPKKIEAVGSANRGVTRQLARVIVAEELEAIAGAHAFWLLLPTTPTSGAWAEMGAFLMGARELRPAESVRVRPLITSGPDPERSIFAAAADHHYPTELSAFEYIRGLDASRTCLL